MTLNGDEIAQNSSSSTSSISSRLKLWSQPTQPAMVAEARITRIANSCSNTGSSRLHLSSGIAGNSGQENPVLDLTSASSYDLLDSQTSIPPGIETALSSFSGTSETRQVDEAKVQSSNVTAFVTFLKALFGVSLLSSPRVLGETGLVLGTIVYSLIVMACMGYCWCLLHARAKVAPITAAQRQRPTLVSSSLPSIQVKNNEFVHQDSSSTSTKSINAITYGDLGRTLLGPKQSTLINFLIVSLHVCFGAGLVATAMHQIAIVLDWEEDYNSDDNYSSNYNSQDQEAEEDADDEDEVWLKGRLILSGIFFPVIAVLLQFRNIKDLFRICLGGILVFVVGCIGTMLYSTTLVDNDGDGSAIWDIPDNAFEWRWGGIPNFVASTLCAMEGINLALPIANQFFATSPGSSFPSQLGSMISNINVRSSPVPVVTAAVGCYGIVTLAIAYFGYLSGLGGGSGTYNGNDDNDQEDCLFVAHCLNSDVVETIHRLSLAVALLLTLPIILYPSLELLELWVEERYRQIKTGKTASNEKLGDSWNGFVWGEPSDALRRQMLIEEALFGQEPFFPCFHRHWRFRIGHAAAVCLLAIVDRQWERGLVLFKGIGLSIACFVLPVVLFVRAYTVPVVLQQPGLTAALSGLVVLGVVNLVLVILSVFTEHNFLPTEIHDDPLHHHNSADAGRI